MGPNPKLYGRVIQCFQLLLSLFFATKQDARYSCIVFPFGLSVPQSFYVLVAAESACLNGKHAMVLHRVYGSSATYENVQIWEGDIYTGRFVGVINGRNMNQVTHDYEFCVNAGVHTLLLDQVSKAGWATGSYVDVQVDGVTIAHGILDRLETGILTVYRVLLLLGVTHSLHASDDEGGMEVFEHCFRFLVRSRL